MADTRRSFVKKTAVGAVAIALSRVQKTSALSEGLSSVSAGNDYAGIVDAGIWKSKMPINPDISNMRVVCFEDNKMLTKTPSNGSKFSSVNEVIDGEKVAENMDRMAMALAEKSSADTAWKTIFRSSKSWEETKAAIKINGVPSNYVRVAVVKKVIDVLVGFGVKPENIVIYDAAYDASAVYGEYADTKDPTKLRAVVANRSDKMGGKQSVKVPVIDMDCYVPKYLADGTTDILVNIAVNKGHLSDVGTTTLCLKSHYGTFVNNSDTAFYFHPGLGGPNKSSDLMMGAVVATNKTEAIIGGNPVRQQLCIVDSILAMKSGPQGGPDVLSHKLVMGTFAGAVDYCTVKKIREEEMNQKHNETMVKRFLTDFGYAETDPEWIKLDPTGSISERLNPGSEQSTILFEMSGSSLKTSSVKFSIPKNHKAAVQTTVLDLKGNVVARMTSSGSNVVRWDGKTMNGKTVKAGAYVVEMQAGSFRATERLSIIR